MPPPGKLHECMTFSECGNCVSGPSDPYLKPGKNLIALGEEPVLHQKSTNCSRFCFRPGLIDDSMIELAGFGQQALQQCNGRFVPESAQYPSWISF